MCGIAGIFSLAPVPVEPAVRRMMRAMVHRGPDDEDRRHRHAEGENCHGREQRHHARRDVALRRA